MLNFFLSKHKGQVISRIYTVHSSGTNLLYVVFKLGVFV